MNLSEYILQCDGLYGGADSLEHTVCKKWLDPYDLSTIYPPTLKLLIEIAEKHDKECPVKGR